MGKTPTLVSSDALRVLLHHEASIKHKQEVFCLLLCTSKATAAALAAHCTGHIEVSAFLDCVSDVTMFTAWLRKHGMLLKTLSLCMGHLSTKQRAQASTAIAMAMQQGASTCRSSLQIQHFSCPYPTETVPALLQQLPNSALTGLHIRYSGDPINDSSLGTALAQLSGLQSLTVGRRFDTGASRIIDPVLRHVSRLTRLTALVVDTSSWVGDTAHLRHLPQQLQELTVSIIGADDQGPSEGPCHPYDCCRSLLLDHVTGLTRLVTDVILSVDDLLPASLLQLTAPDIADVKPLQDLLQLREVSLLHVSEVTYDVLECLSLLTQLTAVTLMYELAGEVDLQTLQSAKAWKLLPVISLAVFDIKYDSSQLADQTWQQMSTLSELKHLALLGVSVDVLNLCAHLVCLSELESLQLSVVSAALHDDEEARLMESMAVLPNLRRLSLDHIDCYRVAAKLGAAAKLTSLVLQDSDISEYAINSILCQTKTLASLELIRCPSIADAVLPVIGMSQQLTKLVLRGTQVSEQGAQELMSLTHIQDLVLLRHTSDNHCYFFVKRPG